MRNQDFDLDKNKINRGNIASSIRREGGGKAAQSLANPSLSVDRVGGKKLDTIQYSTTKKVFWRKTGREDCFQKLIANSEAARCFSPSTDESGG